MPQRLREAGRSRPVVPALDVALFTQAKPKRPHNVRGRVVPIEGASPPTNVAIVEWDSVDDAFAFYRSKVWTDWAPEREKAQKTIRRYVIEVEK
jgi:hypothetical protein